MGWLENTLENAISLLADIIVSIETGGPRATLDPWLWVGSTSDSSTPSVGCTRIGYSEGDSLGRLVCAPSLTMFFVALYAQQVFPHYYLYNWRGLTGLGLEKFHPDIMDNYGLA